MKSLLPVLSGCRPVERSRVPIDRTGAPAMSAENLAEQLPPGSPRVIRPSLGRSARLLLHERAKSSRRASAPRPYQCQAAHCRAPGLTIAARAVAPLLRMRQAVAVAILICDELATRRDDASTESGYKARPHRGVFYPIG